MKTGRPTVLFGFFFTLLAFAAIGKNSYAKNEAETSAGLSQFIDPLIGTKISRTATTSRLDDSGLTQPGPMVPFGMISWGPNTISDHDETITDKYQKDVGYNYSSHRIEGFTLTHLSGAGCPNGGELPLLPFVGEPSTNAVAFDHRHEKASAGFYEVELENQIKIELTATERTGYGRFSFKNLTPGKNYGLQFLHSHRANPPAKGEVTHPSKFRFTDARHFVGSVEAGDFCDSTNKYRLYFVGELNVPSGQVSVDQNLARVTYTAEQKNTAALELKISISYVSEAGALKNFAAETQTQHPPEIFDSVHQRATHAWDSALAKIQTDHRDDQLNRRFYTALYHSLLHPNIEDDVDGKYRGYDHHIHQVAKPHHHYANFSGWDIYRSEIQLLSILYPQRANDMAQSLLSAADQCGALPQWALHDSNTAVMIGDAGSILMQDFLAFGIHDFDTEKTFAYLKKAATDPKSACNGHLSRPGLKSYLEKGYVSASEVNFGATATTLEYAMTDYAVSRFAHALGKTADEKQFLKQSQSWKNLWWKSPKNPALGFIRGRTDEGTWRKPFFPNHNPSNVKDGDDDSETLDQGFVEGTSAQYSFMMPFDFPGILSRMGSASEIQKRLQNFFSRVTGGMNTGFMNIGNEPSFSTPWIYNWAGNPSATQEVVHRVLETSFFDTPDGLPGNDDLGATSSWYIFATLGLYPAIPGEAGFSLHSPSFTHATIHLDNGNSILIDSSGVGNYVNALDLNTMPTQQTWVKWADLKNNGSLHYYLMPKPTQWGVNH